MSHVDTSIGFSLRSEPPLIASDVLCEAFSLTDWRNKKTQELLASLAPTAVAICIGNTVLRAIEKGWKGAVVLLTDIASMAAVGILVTGFFYLWYVARFDRQVRAIRAAGLDSPVVHFTAEGQWVTFRFASGREFVDRWDRLLRFKSAPEFTEFEFPANPPIIIPTMAIPVETLRTISQFCNAEKIPSETKR
jgi:hypothetical protein